MTTIAATQFAAAKFAQVQVAMGRVDAQQGQTGLSGVRPQKSAAEAPVKVELSYQNAALASLYAAQAYDCRGVHTDASPRGVEIDRVEMIKEGFAELRNVLSAISAAANPAPTGGQSLNTTM